MHIDAGKLLHGYANVDDRIVWDVIEGRLQALIETLADLSPGP